MRDGGKGDKPRPIPNRIKFEKNWDAIFNTDPNTKEREKAVDELLENYGLKPNDSRN